MKNDNINKKLRAAPLLLALLLVFSACSAVPADNPEPVIDVPYVTVTATPDINNRYAFDMWTDGSYEATRTIIVRKPINLKALFVKAR